MAATDQSLVLLVFSAEWCGPCKLLKKNSLTSTNFTEGGGALRVAEVDIDADSQTTRAFDVNGVPTLVLLTADGKIVTRQTGYMDAKQLLAWLEAGRERAKLGQWEGVAVGPQLDAYTRKATTEDLSEEDMKKLIALLAQSDPAERNATSRLLLAQRERTVPLLIEAASDPYLGTRIAAVELLQRLAPGKVTVDPWQSPAELADVVATLKKWWAESGKLPAAPETLPADPTTLGAIKAALLQLAGADAARRTEAMSALVAHGPAALPAVREAIKRAERAGDQRVLLALEDVRWTILIPDALEQRIGGRRTVFARSPSYERQTAVARLAHGGRDAIPALRELVNDSDPLVVENAVRALSGIGGADTIPAMSALLQAADANLRMTAAQALGQTKNKDAITPLLALVSDPNEVVACAALSAIEQLNSTRSYSSRREQAPELITALRSSLKDPRWRVRAAAAEVAGKLEAKELASALKTLLDDADGFVVKNALDALGKVGGSPDTPQLAALAERHAGLRSQVVQLLVQSGSEESVKVVEEVYQTSDTGERIAILRALSEREAEGEQTSRATWKPLLTNAVASPDPQLRRAAAETLGMQPARFAAQFVGPLLQDEDAETRAAAARAILSIISGEKSRPTSGHMAFYSGFTDSFSSQAKPKTNAPAVSIEQIATWHASLKQKQGDKPDLTTAAAIFVTGESNKELRVLESALAGADQEALKKFAGSPALAAVAPRLTWPEGRTVVDRFCASPGLFVNLLRHASPGSPLSEYLFEPARFRAAVEPASGSELEEAILLLLSTPSANWSLLSDQPRIAPVVAALLESTNTAWQAAALYVLSGKGDAQNLVLFERAAGDTNAWLRVVAVRGLTKLSKERSALEARLGPMVGDPDKIVARRAALALLEPEITQPSGLGYELETFVYDKIHAGSYSYSSSSEQRPLTVLENKPAFLETARRRLAEAKPDEAPVFTLLLAQYGDFMGLDKLIAQSDIAKESESYWRNNMALTGIALSKDAKYMPHLKKLVAQANDASALQQVLQALRGMTGAEVRELRVEINRKMREGFN